MGLMKVGEKFGTSRDNIACISYCTDCKFYNCKNNSRPFL